ncbi:hypothetical protein FHS18_000559 [Paenibacillus phyllosphaerae]|uniref:Uncharacterized protein n=1 Tax=Paenibacillus phyllosphaerae TaxID=274593 RepID=A0A7W5AUR3_9BACL|nr:hypothetical protein [Paenibacillus phyllosphaerae]MBB3108531.1 hypothetical protein [Paenibacillus phyllosphaerae]
MNRAGQAGRASTPVETAQNGSMVQDLDDLKRLGHDMERMRTNQELEEDGLVPDPKQE